MESLNFNLSFHVFTKSPDYFALIYKSHSECLDQLFAAYYYIWGGKIGAGSPDEPEMLASLD